MVSHADSPRSHGSHDDEALLEPPSKSSRKRAMQALQDLGAELVALPVSRLRKVPLPDALFVAIRDAQRLPRRDEALRRQMQYIGKLMRSVDPEPIQARLELFRGQSSAEVARQHRLEKLRSDLVEDEKIIEYIVDTWPGVDIQHLRTLRRNALKEREQNKPPKAFRELFRVLSDLDRGEAGDEDGGDESDDGDDMERA